jgi:hypothetical protein
VSRELHHSHAAQHGAAWALQPDIEEDFFLVDPEAYGWRIVREANQLKPRSDLIDNVHRQLSGP